MSPNLSSTDGQSPAVSASALLDLLARQIGANTWVGSFDEVLQSLRALRFQNLQNPIILIVQPVGTSASNLLCDESERLTAQDLAARFGVRLDVLRRRLERWRQAEANDQDWWEVQNPRCREARFLYRLGAIRHLVSGCAADAEAAGSDGH